VLENLFAISTLESEILISLIYAMVYKAKKKFSAQQNLFELYNWVLVILVPATAAIPVIFSIFPQNPQLILAPFWFGFALWLLIASKAELNENERPHRLKILLRTGLTMFTIAIGAHLIIFFISPH